MVLIGGFFYLVKSGYFKHIYALKRNVYKIWTEFFDFMMKSN